MPSAIVQSPPLSSFTLCLFLMFPKSPCWALPSAWTPPHATPPPSLTGVKRWLFLTAHIIYFYSTSSVLPVMCSAQIGTDCVSVHSVTLMFDKCMNVASTCKDGKFFQFLPQLVFVREGFRVFLFHQILTESPRPASQHPKLSGMGLPIWHMGRECGSQENMGIYMMPLEISGNIQDIEMSWVRSV